MHLQLHIARDTFLDNLFDILRFEAERNVDKLRKPVDKDKWATEPAVVNAFYNPNKNDIGTHYATAATNSCNLFLRIVQRSRKELF